MESKRSSIAAWAGAQVKEDLECDLTGKTLGRKEPEAAPMMMPIRFQSWSIRLCWRSSIPGALSLRSLAASQAAGVRVDMVRFWSPSKRGPISH